MMQLTNEEESNLKKQTMKTSSKPVIPRGEVKNFFCSEKHRLAYAYFRSFTDKKLGRIPGLYYCPRCQKLYKPSIVEIDIT